MRYFVRLFLLAVALAGMTTAVARAQSSQPPQKETSPFIFYQNPIPPQISGVWTPLELEQIEESQVPQNLLTEEPPSDACSDAPSLLFSPQFPGDGGSGIVLSATQDPSDPVLACQWGSPPSPTGFRTVWYRFAAPANGTVRLETQQSNYDTVLAVYRDQAPASGEDGEPIDPCTNIAEFLREVACNDDALGFTSDVLVQVEAGVTYYILIADWQQGNAEPPLMLLGALWEPIESNWDRIVTQPFAPVVTRHAIAIQNEQIYIFGGQTLEGGLPVITNQVRRLDARTGQWSDIASIPGPGLANTTAALLNGRVYLPGGDENNPTQFNGIHWVYDIASDVWDRVASIPLNQLPNNAPIAFMASAVPPTQNRYFVTGGVSTSEAGLLASRNTFVYTPASDSWGTLAPMGSERYAHVSGWVEAANRGVCVAGGLKPGVDAEGNEIFVLLTGGECYVPGGQWTPTGDMVVPRFGAGSAVGRDGRWYVFGGFNARGVPVATTEYYDPLTNTWSALPPANNLGGTFQNPARGWPAGGFINNSLWVVGGSIRQFGEEVFPSVDKLYVPTVRNYFPVSIGSFDSFTRPDDTFVQARAIAFGIPQARNFDRNQDFFDFFFFDLRAPRNVTITLEVPDGANFDLLLYGQNKLLWGESSGALQGQDELISLNLAPRRYFVMVKRIFPANVPDPGQVYRITVQ